MLGVFEASAALGLGGLVTMAALQLGHGHADTGGGHMGHVDAGGHGLCLGDAGHGLHLGDAGHGAHLGDVGHAGHGDAGAAHAALGDAGHTHSDAGHHGHSDEARIPMWLIPSPIRICSWLIGFGIAGMLLSVWFPITSVVYAIAVANALAFERFFVRPYWSFFFRFASSPGTNLEGAVASKALAITRFDRKGRGLVRLCVDGQDRDVLAYLPPAQRGLPVHRGDALFVERANPDNSVLVSRPDASTKG